MRHRRFLAALLLLTSLPALSATKSSDEPPHPMSRAGGLLWTRYPINAADAPGRCMADRLFTRFRQDEVYTYGPHGSLALGDQIRGMLTDANVRYYPWHLLQLVKTSDYFAHRAAMLDRMETALSEVPPDRRVKALGNYAMALLYLGEDKHLVGFFAPNTKAYEDAAQAGEVDYALGVALYRLGQNELALPHAERAWKELTDAPLDTRWQLMLIESELQGDKFFASKNPAYTIKHINEYFPMKTWKVPYVDATAEVGLSTTSLYGGYGTAAFFDADGDGWDDLYLERKFFPPHLYRNDHGRFEQIPDSRLGPPAPCNMLFAIPGDYDGDGKPDIARNCCNFDGGGQMELLKNQGNFTFEDVAKTAGLGVAPAGTAMCWGDYDLDGRLDLLVNGFHGASILYHNNGDGTFTDVTKQAGIETPGNAKTEWSFGAMGCAFSDFQEKRYPDLFIQGWGWHQMYRNNRDGTFTDVTEKSGIGDGSNRRGYMAETFDYNNDGKMDILVGSYVVGNDERYGISPICTCSNLLSADGFSKRELKAGPSIFRNNGDGTFTDLADTMKFLPLGGMSYGHGDWNNDGYEDLVVGYGGGYIQQDEPFAFYQNNRNGTFTNMTPFLMHGLWGKAHGIAFADVRHVGVMDVVIENGGAQYGDLWPTRYLRNTTTGKHFLEVKLKGGPGTNPTVIGGRVRVWAGRLKQVKDVESGGTFAVNSQVLHFGLADHTKADRVTVEWPNRNMDTTVLKDVPVDQAIEVDETTGRWRTLWTHPVAAKK